MRFQVCSILFFILGTLRIVSGITPFPTSSDTGNCFTECKVEECSETLKAAYSKSGLDENGRCNDSNTKLFLFTKCNRENPEFLHKYGNGLPNNTNYSPTCKTIIVVHGYVGGLCEFAAIREIKDQYLCKGNYNIILVDWTWGNRPDYYVAIQNAKCVAKEIAFLIKKIMNKYPSVEANQFHLVGHSLGGQLVAFAGQKVKLYVGQKVGCIIALDPAGPGFYTDNLDERLDLGDAEYVQVIHTNGGPCLPDLGYCKPAGHADFFPNGGHMQKSCYKYGMESILKGDLAYGLFCISTDFGCSHCHAFQFFKTSINAGDCQFVGVECPSCEDFTEGKCNECGEDGSKCAVMGADWECYPRKEGNNSYYLTTDLSCPYCNNDWIQLGGFKDVLETSCCKKTYFPNACSPNVTCNPTAPCEQDACC